MREKYNTAGARLYLAPHVSGFANIRSRVQLCSCMEYNLLLRRIQMKSKIINHKFYSRPTLKVAQELLGCFLVRKYRGKTIRGMITETEAYAGEDDLASHASRGRTPRTEAMYGEPGRAYVYMIYGMYHCLNIVTEKKDFPAAVLIRGVEINPSPALPLRKGESPNFSLSKREIKGDLNGPGKLCKFLRIDKRLNGWDMTKGEKLWIASPGLVRLGRKERNLKITKSKRIGVDYAKHCKEYLWRFSI